MSDLKILPICNCPAGVPALLNERIEKLDRRLRQTQEEMAEYMRQHFWREKDERIAKLEKENERLKAFRDEICEAYAEFKGCGG